MSDSAVAMTIYHNPDFYRYYNYDRVRVAPARIIFYYQEVTIQIVGTPLFRA
jgi:hypothetical protein